uniref:Reverse transcriptase domain-containing protein n=1 Tax=Tanacetum cinerariifolium TaxID=118510 RepID=A0A699GQH9_TANCI|nr:hypothetical protein [Tanacetum cinerariifolium]
MHLNRGKIVAIDADEGISLLDVKTDEEEVAMDAESQERTNLNAASKGVSAVITPELVSTVEPTVIDDEDVIMKIAQTLIKLKEEKARIIDEKIAQKLHDEEVQKVTARDEQERADMEKALELQRQLDEREDDIDWSVVAEQNMLEIIPVPDFRVEALQVKYHIIEWEIHTEGPRKYWKIIRFGERFSSVEPSEDKERALWVELKKLFESDANDVLWKLQRYMHAPLTWRLYSDCGVHHVSSIKGHEIYMLTKKDYPLSNAVMILMLSGKLQVEEDTEMARDLVMKIFMEANRPRNR